MARWFVLGVVACLGVGCGDSDDVAGDRPGNTGGAAGGGGTAGVAGISGTGGSLGGSGGSGAIAGSGGAPSVPQYAELWYAVDQLLVLVQLDTADGSVSAILSSDITTPIDSGQSGITMLEDGSLLMSRLSEVDSKSRFYHIPDPPRDGSSVTPVELGVMPDDILVEGLYTDCESRVYAMDSGVNHTSAEGNRLLRFTGDIAGGDFTYVVVSNLATADVADIDDMGPGIDNNEITDNPGLAIDSGHVHDFNYETGSGTEVATAGTYGIHALGGPLFADNKSRLYVLDIDANLYEVDPATFTLSPVLGTGPTPAAGVPGWSGLAGPLTSCKTGFTPPT